MITRTVPVVTLPGLHAPEPQPRTGYREEQEAFAAQVAAAARPSRWRRLLGRR